MLAFLAKDLGLAATAAFLDRADFYDDTPGPLLSMRLWNYDDPRFVTLRMEDVTQSVGDVVGRKLRERFGAGIVLPEDADFSFQRFSGDRAPGQLDENSHYRLGVAGQWRKDVPSWLARYVVAHNREVFGRFYPECLEVLDAPLT
jgi:hypothetical protein